VYVDQRVMERPLVILGGGGRSSKIRMAPEALRAAGAAVVEGLAYPREAARA
jgi:prolyl-tRNA editing enzyme YbaK/EbsC (Cys-tRNA(Pro) deacylase)